MVVSARSVTIIAATGLATGSPHIRSMSLSFFHSFIFLSHSFLFLSLFPSLSFHFIFFSLSLYHPSLLSLSSHSRSLIFTLVFPPVLSHFHFSFSLILAFLSHSHSLFSLTILISAFHFLCLTFSLFLFYLPVTICFSLSFTPTFGSLGAIMVVFECYLSVSS